MKVLATLLSLFIFSQSTFASVTESLNKEVVTQFYSSFQAKDFRSLRETLSDDLLFSDPVFPELTGVDAHAMWHMFTKNESLRVSFKVLRAEGDKVYGQWIADYDFNGRPVHNVINSTFNLHDGKIVKHEDHFDIYRWGKQALSPSQYFFSYLILGPMAQYMAAKRLKAFKEEQGY